MRVVIFEEETLEPVTVVNLPGMTDRCLEERKFWRVPLPHGGPVRDADGRSGWTDAVRYVDLEFERFARTTLTHGEQLSWLCLTRAADLAMLLTPDFLPGQAMAVQKLQDENERLAELMAGVLSSDVSG